MDEQQLGREDILRMARLAGLHTGKRLGLLKEIVPGVSRILLLYNPASPIEQQIGMPAVVAAASAVGLAIQPVEVRTPEEFPKAIAAVNLERTDGLVVVGNPVNWRNRQAIADFALTKRLPSIGEERQFVESGVLVSYGTNYTELFRRSATFVDKVLKGAKPADLPVELPTTFDMVINLKAAKALDITIPASVIARADEVIE
jgi:putative ABC transport system substrate-binding protein